MCTHYVYRVGIFAYYQLHLEHSSLKQSSIVAVGHSRRQAEHSQLVTCKFAVVADTPLFGIVKLSRESLKLFISCDLKLTQRVRVCCVCSSSKLAKLYTRPDQSWSTSEVRTYVHVHLHVHCKLSRQSLCSTKIQGTDTSVTFSDILCQVFVYLAKLWVWCMYVQASSTWYPTLYFLGNMTRVCSTRVVNYHLKCVIIKRVM